MHNIFQKAAETILAAEKEYLATLTELSGMEERLCSSYNAKLQFKKSPGKEKAKAIVAECNSIKSQVTKIHNSVEEARARMHAKIDGANASIVQNLQGLCSYGVASGKASAGVKYLLGECQEFNQAKGFELRQACYDSVIRIFKAVTSDDSASESKGIAADRLAIYETFDKMEEGEAKTAYFKSHKVVIAAVHDLLRLQ